MTGALRRAVFLDRDGTLIEDPGYLRDPGEVRLLPGAAQAVARLNAMGWLVVVVSNQSGIARGLVTEAAYRAVQARMTALLAAGGARIDGEYFCPHLPELSGPCECRKPGVLLYTQAAGQLGIDLAASWWIGDRLRDVLPAERLGGRGILVHTGQGIVETALPEAARFAQEPDLEAAAAHVLANLPRPGASGYVPAP